jgi:hypothetical protein
LQPLDQGIIAAFAHYRAQLVQFVISNKTPGDGAAGQIAACQKQWAVGRALLSRAHPQRLELLQHRETRKYQRHRPCGTTSATPHM